MSEKLNISKPELGRWLEISKDASLLKALSENKISKESAFEIIDLKERLDLLVTGKKMTPDRARQLLRDMTNNASRRTITQLRREISNELREYEKSESQSALFEDELSPREKARERYYSDLSSQGAEVDNSGLRPDLIARLSSDQQKKYGTKFLWIKIVDTSPAPLDKITPGLLKS